MSHYIRFNILIFIKLPWLQIILMIFPLWADCHFNHLEIVFSELILRQFEKYALKRNGMKGGER